MDALTSVGQTYMATFGSYVNQFIGWGQWLFVALLTINIVWLSLWYAFDRDSFADSIGQFIRRFFVIALFYTIMVNHAWLLQLLQTSEAMGSVLTGAKTDPSSIISQGIGIANKIIQPVEASSILSFGFGELIAYVAYLVVLFCFISIALQLALTLILTTALIVLSTFFLGFAALSATSQIARNTLDVILANCVKLLGIYVVIAAGSQTISTIVSSIPTSLVSLDGYAWIVATTLLFWLLTKNLPEQLAKIVSGVVQESRGHDAAAIAMAATTYARLGISTATVGASAVTGAAEVAGKSAGSVAYSAASNLKQNLAMASNSPIGAGAAAVGAALHTAKDVTKAAGGTIADHFKHLASKLTGGEGIAKSTNDIQGVSSRIHQAAKNRFESMKSSTSSDTSSSSSSEKSSQATSKPNMHTESVVNRSKP